MLIIFKKVHGDFAEDSYETVEKVLQIGGKGLTEQKVLDEYQVHLNKIAAEAGIEIEPLYGGHKRSQKRSKLMKENTLMDFMKKQYKAKEVPNHIELYI